MHKRLCLDIPNIFLFKIEKRIVSHILDGDLKLKLHRCNTESAGGKKLSKGKYDDNIWATSVINRGHIIVLAAKTINQWFFY